MPLRSRRDRILPQPANGLVLYSAQILVEQVLRGVNEIHSSEATRQCTGVTETQDLTLLGKYCNAQQYVNCQVTKC